MSTKVIGGDKVARAIAKARVLVEKHMADANRKNGDEVIRRAKVLHPGDGVNRAAIKGTPQTDGSYLCDFGPKAKVTEGKRGPSPFVNPALQSTRKQRKARQRRAVRKAVKEAFSG